MDMHMGQHALPPGVQRENDSRLAAEFPLSDLEQGLLGSSKEELIHGARIGSDQRIELMGNRKDRVVVRGGEIPRDNLLQPRFALEPTAVGTVPIMALAVENAPLLAGLASIVGGTETPTTAVEEFIQHTAFMERNMVTEAKGFGVA